MLRFVDERRTPRGTSRREWLRIGGAFGLGMLGGLPAASARDAAATPGFGRAKSVILVFASGGQSQLEMWDPKPDAPLEVRGEFGAIRSAVPGTLLGEHMPRLAGMADRYTIVRSMSHEDVDHGSAVYLSLTGHYHERRSANPKPRPIDRPVHGAMLARVRPHASFLAPAVHVNAPAIIAPNDLAPGQFGGLLGRDYDPLTIGDVTAGPIVVPGLETSPSLPPVRIRERRSLLESLERYGRRLEDVRVNDVHGLYEKAFDLLDETRARSTFDLSAEPDALRDRYGRNRSGQACLLARRLVEAGVPLITVMWNHHSRGQDLHPEDSDAYGWDTHNDIFSSLRDHLLPRFDLGFSALLEDLDDRGLLDETLVICMGEFGRAPLVALEKSFKGSSPGRKHWASVYSIVAAGAGVAGGGVLGRSDDHGAHPRADRYAPWDVAATIFSALGIDPTGHFADPAGRPLQLTDGRPIAGLYA